MQAHTQNIRSVKEIVSELPDDSQKKFYEFEKVAQIDEALIQVLKCAEKV